MFLKSSVSLKQEIKCDRIIDFIRILFTVNSESLLKENNFLLLHVGNIDNVSKVIIENPIIKDKIEYVELKGSLCVCHSTDIRKSIAQGIGLEKGLLNDNVLEYINQNNLYN